MGTLKFQVLAKTITFIKQTIQYIHKYPKINNTLVPCSVLVFWFPFLYSHRIRHHLLEIPVFLFVLFMRNKCPNVNHDSPVYIYLLCRSRTVLIRVRENCELWDRGKFLSNQAAGLRWFTKSGLVDKKKYNSEPEILQNSWNRLRLNCKRQ
jgi:hypothetical protein